MFSGFLNQFFFLQAVGWAILHSFWQSGLLWLLYKAITAGNEKVSAAFKYNVSLSCLAGSLLWFIFTAADQYVSLQNGAILGAGFFVFNQLLPVPSQNMLTFLSFTYLMLLAFYVIQFGRQYISLHSFRNSQLSKAPVEMRLFTQQAAFRLGIKKDVGLWLSEKVDAPFVTGFFKPVILLPFSLLNHLTTAQAEAVILHELAHVKRNDYLINIFQLVAEKLLFFSPFARLLSDAAKAERENCCDDWVLNFRFNQHEYAHALLQVEQLRNQQLILAMNATSGKKKLLKRIKRIFAAEPAAGINNVQRAKLITVALGIVTAVVLLIPVTQTKKVAAISAASVTQAPATAFLLVNEHPALPENREIIIKANQQTAVVPVQKKEIAAKHGDPTETYTEEPASTIMLNEELLETTAEPSLVAMQVNDEPTATTGTLMVKVEEEVAGSKQKKVYYVQLNKSNGQTEIKPIAIIHQPVADSLKPLTNGSKQARTTGKRLSSRHSKPI